MEITVKIDVQGFKGEAVIDVRPFTERAKIIKEVDVKVENGEIKSNSEIEKAVKMIEVTKKNVKSISVEHESGLQVTDLNELECYDEGQAVIAFLGSQILGGVKLSKN